MEHDHEPRQFSRNVTSTATCALYFWLVWYRTVVIDDVTKEKEPFRTQANVCTPPLVRRDCDVWDVFRCSDRQAFDRTSNPAAIYPLFKIKSPFSPSSPPFRSPLRPSGGYIYHTQKRWNPNPSMTMTSLQRRSTNGNGTRNGIKGAFELCFAQGLDLSEFDTSSSLTQTTTLGNHNHNNTAPTGQHQNQQHQQQQRCASAELLPIIQKRAQEKHYNEQEELRMHQTVQTRAWNIQQQLKTTSASTTASISILSGGNNRNMNDTNVILSLTDTLVSMHGKDDYGGAKQSVVKKATASFGRQSQTRKHNKPTKGNHKHNGVVQQGRRRQQQHHPSLQSHGGGIKKGIPKVKRIQYH